MSYTTTQRDAAIISIGQGKANVDYLPMYEELESFNWVYINRADGKFESIKLTYSGEQLFRQLNRFQ